MQSAQRVWPSGLGLPQSRHRPRAFRSALSEACASRRFFLYASLRTLLGTWLASLSAMSCWISSINSVLIRRRGLMPLALRRFSEYWRHHARCFSAQVAQRVCPCMAGWLQRQSPCSLRSWWVRAGFLGFDGRCFAEGDLGCRRGKGFDRLDLGLLLALGFRFGMNTVSTNNCGLVLCIPMLRWSEWCWTI